MLLPEETADAASEFHGAGGVDYKIMRAKFERAGGVMCRFWGAFVYNLRRLVLVVLA